MVRSSPVMKLTITIEGVTYDGTYYTHAERVYVQYGTRKKETQIGGSPAESIARMLLSELVREELGLKAKGK
jgi:hypothetical protein